VSSSANTLAVLSRVPVRFVVPVPSLTKAPTPAVVNVPPRFKVPEFCTFNVPTLLQTPNIDRIPLFAATLLLLVR